MLKDADLSTLALELAEIAEVTALDDIEASRMAIHGVRPRFLCTPPTPEALATCLAQSDRAGAAAIPWGGGTQRRLGMPPRAADIVVATSQLNRLVEYEPADLTATAQAGMPYAELQAVLKEHGQWLPLDPPVKPGATIGGLVATNASGPRRLKDGGFRDLVIGTRVANLDGTVTKAGGRVVKNVTGYDLNKLHIGALGTLGILVDVTFKVAPRPETERSWFATFQSVETAARALTHLLQRPLAPTALDLLNHRAASRAGLSVPVGGWALLARASGFPPAVERHLAEFEAAARAAGGAADAQVLVDDFATHLWTMYVESSADLRWSANALTCRLAVPPAALGQLCDRIADVGEEPIVWAHATGAAFWSVANAASVEPAIPSKLRELAAEMGGALVVENWTPAQAGIDVWGTPGGPLALMRAIKDQYDPRGTLNPGRFVGGI